MYKLKLFFFVRYNVVISQNLEETFTGQTRLKKSYRSGFSSSGKRSGKYGKFLNLNNLLKNVVPLFNVKRNFSSKKFQEFKKLIKYNNKYAYLIKVLTNINFLHNAYQKTKLNQKITIKALHFKILDSLDYN